MTPDEARDLFSDAFEGELDAATKEAFEAALADDAELRAEYASFRDAVAGTRAVSLADLGPAAHVDLLSGVQSKLRTRSRGRFYRDRFSTLRPGQTWWPLVLALLSMIVFGVAWAGLHFVQIDEAGSHGTRP